MPPLPPSLTILGSGITSLSFAHRLTTLSPNTKVTIIDASKQVGGWMKTQTLKTSDGFDVHVEEGPRTVRPKGGRGAARMLQLVNDLDLEKSLLTIPISHPSAQNRFLLHPQTSLLRLPSSPLSLLTTIHKPLTRALLLAIIKEPFQPKPSSPLSDESVDSFIRRRFGPYVADHMISAMVHGIYATDSRKLSVRSAFPWLWEAERRRGSVVKALIGGLGEKTAEEKRKEEEEARAWSDLGELGVKMKKGISVWGLEGGLGKLGDRFKEVLEKRGVEFLLEHKVESLESIQGGGIKVALPAKTFETPLVVSTLSASTLSKLLPSSSFLPHLAYNPSSTVSVVTLIFPSPPLSAPPYHPPGFGYLVPRSNQSNPHGVLGVIFDSSSMSAVDSIRTQSKIVKFTLMMGGPHYTSSNPPPSDPTTLIPIAVEHLRSSFPDLPKDLEPIAASAKTQVDCIPTYQPGHGARMRELHEAIETGEWRGKLAVAGASYGGVSLNDCCEAGATLAEGLFAGEEIVTGLEKFKTWDSYTPRVASSGSTSSPISPSIRSYSTCSRQRRSTRTVNTSSRVSRRQFSTSSPIYASPSSQQQQQQQDTRPVIPGLVALLGNLIYFGIPLTCLYIWFVIQNNPAEFRAKVMSYIGGEGVAKEWSPPWGEKIVTFEDVKGCDEAREELQEFVDFLIDPSRFSALGGRPSKGILLEGPPGTGKTMLARAVAGESGVPFFFASGSDFEEVYWGVGAQRVRQLFAAAKEKSPAIIFIDELDAIGGKREEGADAPLAGEGTSRKQTLNQLLTELDGFGAGEEIVIIAATNFAESLDPALVRPGRFDRHVNVPLPDVAGRAAILSSYLGAVIAESKLDPILVARGTPGFSGADLENLVNQAAVYASKMGAKAIGLSHLEWAKDRIRMGVERKSRFIPQDVLNVSAYVEAAHALVALNTPGSIPLHKVSIIPRGSKLSVTSQVPSADQDSMSYKEFIARLDVALAGREAELLVFASASDRTGDDLSTATKIATKMVKEYGYSDKVGLMTVIGDRASYFLSRNSKKRVEDAVKDLVESAAARARQILVSERSQLDQLACALLSYETLNAKEIKLVLEGKEVPRKIAPLVQPSADPPMQEEPRETKAVDPKEILE